MAVDEELPEVVITGRDVFSGGAGMAPFDLGGMAAALDAYYAALAASQYVPPEPAPSVDPIETVVVTAPVPRAPPAAPPSILDDLLSRPVGSAPPAPTPPSEFERLVNRPPASEFDRLLERPRHPPADLPSVTVTGRISSLGRLLSRAAGPLGVVGLLPTMFHTGVVLDDLATDAWTRRLFGEDPRELEEGNAPRRSPTPPRGSTREPTLEQVTVTGRAPRPSPLALPIFGGVPGMGELVRADVVSPEPAPAPSGRPSRVAIPIGGLIDPLTLPSQLASPLPGLLPFAPPRPPDLGSPGTGPGRPPPRGPQAPPAVTWPGGLGDPTGCDCKPTKTKKKPKKARDECWRGTYTEGPTSLKKVRRVRVSCATGEELSPLER